jgi:hypothetical protein
MSTHHTIPKAAASQNDESSLYSASVSDELPGRVLPFRTFFYAPGVGFDNGRSVYVGFNEFPTHAEANEAARSWLESARRRLHRRP